MCCFLSNLDEILGYKWAEVVMISQNLKQQIWPLMPNSSRPVSRGVQWVQVHPQMNSGCSAPPG